MVAGKLVIDEGTITTVNEQKVRDDFNEAVERGLYELEGPMVRWAELATEVEPYLFDFYRPWAEEKVAPGYEYNTSTGPVGFTGGTRREGR